MLYKCQVALILLLPISFSTLSVTAYNISIAELKKMIPIFLPISLDNPLKEP
jgi:hypothetical protein